MAKGEKQPEKGKIKDSPITAVMISIGLAFVGLAIAIYAINNLNLRFGETKPIPQPIGEVQQEVGNPKETVNKFYTWYLAYEGNPLSDEAYLESELLSDGFKDEIKQTLESFDSGGFDPLLCAQDIPPEFNTGNTEVDENTATVDLEQVFPTGKRLVPIELEKTNGKWLIINVVCSEAEAQQGLGEKQTIIVYYSNAEKRPVGVTDCSLVYGTEREITSTENIFEQKLNELFKGPTEEEKEQGFSSFFSEKTADVLKEVVIEDSTAYVNLADIRNIIPSANSSCGSQQFITSVEETIKHNNRNIENVIIAINNDPKTFYEWMQIGCTEENNNCDPGPLAD
jgi:hypothetical protein